MASPESSMVNKGKPHPPDLDDFLEFFQAGGRMVIFDPKYSMHSIFFGVFKAIFRIFCQIISKIGRGWGGGGGQPLFGRSPKKSSAGGGFPKIKRFFLFLHVCPR